MTARQYLCFMCRAPDHMMYACPHVKRFIELGWMMQANDGSNRLKLKNDKPLPKDSPDMPKYQLIEKMAKELGWDKADVYFVHVEDEDEKEMNCQMSGNVQIEVFASMINGLVDRIKAMENGGSSSEASSSHDTKN